MDDIDRRVLIEVQKNGRQTNVNLAKSVGLSPCAMLARMRRLEDEGCIRGYRAIIDPACLDLGLQAVIAIQARHSTNALATSERGIMGVQGVSGPATGSAGPTTTCCTRHAATWRSSA